QELDLGAFSNASLSQQFLSLSDILAEGVLAGVAKQTFRNDFLNQGAVAAQQGHNFVVVDSVADSFANIDVIQRSLGGIHTEVSQRSRVTFDQSNVGVAFQSSNLLRAKAVNDIDVTGFDCSLQVSQLGLVAHNHTLEGRSGQPVVGVQIQNVLNVALPAGRNI